MKQYFTGVLRLKEDIILLISETDLSTYNLD